jgi:uncharacterized protein YutE (UPF0331/DUF86 family)
MIRATPINFQKVKDNIVGIENGIKELVLFSDMDLDTFKADKKNYGLAEHHFRRVLEGILTIGTHFLSRLPVKTKDYQDVITFLGEQGVIPKDFAERNRKLAGYRNRLVHMYWEVSPEELLEVIKTHLMDLKEFCRFFREVLANPAKFDLEAE